MSRAGALIALTILGGLPFMLIGAGLWQIDAVRRTIAPEWFRAEQIAALQRDLATQEAFYKAAQGSAYDCRLELAKMATTFELNVIQTARVLEPAQAYLLHSQALKSKKDSCASLAQTADEAGAMIKSLKGAIHAAQSGR